MMSWPLFKGGRMGYQVKFKAEVAVYVDAGDEEEAKEKAKRAVDGLEVAVSDLLNREGEESYDFGLGDIIGVEAF